MANNRLYLMCDGCGEGTLVLKSLGGWFAPSYIKQPMEAFMEEHSTCSDWGGCTEPVAFSFKWERHPDPARRFPEAP